MERQKLSIDETEKINQSLHVKMEELDHLLAQAGRAVSAFVKYPAYITAASRRHVTAKRFDLLPVDEHKCIVVMMMSDNRVRSQLLRMQLKVDLEQLPTLVTLLNSHFTAVSPQANPHFIQRLFSQAVGPPKAGIFHRDFRSVGNLPFPAVRILNKNFRIGRLGFHIEKNPVFMPLANTDFSQAPVPISQQGNSFPDPGIGKPRSPVPSKHAVGLPDLWEAFHGMLSSPYVIFFVPLPDKTGGG